MLHYATQHTSKNVTLGIAVKQRSDECYSLIQQAMFVILDCMLGVQSQCHKTFGSVTYVSELISYNSLLITGVKV